MGLARLCVCGLGVNGRKEKSVGGMSREEQDDKKGRRRDHSDWSSSRETKTSTKPRLSIGGVAKQGNNAKRRAVKNQRQVRGGFAHLVCSAESRHAECL